MSSTRTSAAIVSLIVSLEPVFAATAGVNPPSNTSAVASSPTRIDLSWQDTSSNESGFEVRRSSAGPQGTFAPLATTGANATRYADLGLTASRQYCYAVRAFRTSAGRTTYSDSSAVACATTLAPPAPAAPSNVSATPLSDSRIDVVWQDNSTNETGFEVQRALGGPGDTFAVVASTGSGVTAWSNMALSPSTQYCYRVRAFNAMGGQTTFSEFSGATCATTTAPSPPLAPSNIRVYVVSDTRLDVYWQDNSTNETGFEIHRSKDGPEGAFTLAASTGADATAKADIGLTAATQYCYQVRAVKTVAGTTLESAFSPAVCATTRPPPQAPGLHITAVTTGTPPGTSDYWADIWKYDSYWRYFSYVTTVTVPPNGTTTITTLDPFDYRIDMYGVSYECDFTTPSTQFVTVGSFFEPGVTAEFDLKCRPPMTLAIAAGADIYTIKSNGEGLAQLTFDPASDTAPAWSPDGTKMAFQSDRTGSPEIFVMNADGSGAIQLTSSSGGNFRPAWSPDGNRIAFTSRRDGNGEICVMSSDGTGLVNLTNHAAEDSDPTWSPDGTRIAFRSYRDGDSTGIYLMNADGSGASRLTVDPDVVDSQPAWSPDGDWIAMARYACGLESCSQAIWMISLRDDSAATQISLSSPDCESHGEPAWSPDGRKLAFTRTDFCSGGATEVHILRLFGIDNGTSGLMVTSGSNPSWRP